ncbi:hypothetical protein BH10BAC4_BH10BAC4_27160 [soil metagenome]
MRSIKKSKPASKMEKIIPILHDSIEKKKQIEHDLFGKLTSSEKKASG